MMSKLEKYRKLLDQKIEAAHELAKVKRIRRNKFGNTKIRHFYAGDSVSIHSDVGEPLKLKDTITIGKRRLMEVLEIRRESKWEQIIVVKYVYDFKF